MELQLPGLWLLAVFFASLRFGAVFLASSWFGGFRVPRPFRVFFTLAMAMCMVSTLAPETRQAMPVSIGGVIAAAAGELVIGSLFAFALECAFGAFQFGGQLLDAQMGFGIGNLIDPVTRAQSPLLGAALNLFAVTLFFSLNAYHVLLRGLMWSLQAFPPGLTNPSINAPDVITQFGRVFVTGLQLVAGIAVLILLVDLAVAAVSRTMPQMNVFMLSIPLKVLIGLVVLVISLPYMMATIERGFGDAFSFWYSVAG